jgi:hypothetical protein
MVGGGEREILREREISAPYKTIEAGEFLDGDPGDKEGNKPNESH